MDGELAAFLNQRFEEARRHFDGVAEGLRGEIRVVAEGHLGLRLESLTAALDARLNRLESSR